jgi:nitrogen-specific signal transduction histidine kinase
MNSTAFRSIFKTSKCVGKKQGPGQTVQNEEPLETTDELQKVRQLESIAALSGGIAHDYNNLLTVIIGNISLIQSYLDPDDVIFGLLDEAYEASMIAKSLTQKLITFSKGGAPLKQATSISPMVKSATEFSLSGSNIKCEFKIPNNIHWVEIDKTQISQAIHNLVMNAREAMPKGGTIKVWAENFHITEKTNGLDIGKYVRISIKDRGVGIAQENLQKIFDPYFSTKDRGTQKGMGLGLSICHSIIKKHKGDVWVESEIGLGTTFSVLLPAFEGEISEKKPTEKVKTTEEKPLTGEGRILVMDDEKMIINLSGLLLNRLGYEAQFANDGSEAIEMYKKAMESGKPFRAVILDLTIRGGMGGKETIQNLIEIDPQVKGIVASGYSDDPVMKDYEKYGFKGVVVKPYSMHELGENLNWVLTK